MNSISITKEQVEKEKAYTKSLVLVDCLSLVALGVITVIFNTVIHFDGFNTTSFIVRLITGTLCPVILVFFFNKVFNTNSIFIRLFETLSIFKGKSAFTVTGLVTVTLVMNLLFVPLISIINVSVAVHFANKGMETAIVGIESGIDEIEQEIETTNNQIKELSTDSAEYKQLSGKRASLQTKIEEMQEYIEGIKSSKLPFGKVYFSSLIPTFLLGSVLTFLFRYLHMQSFLKKYKVNEDGIQV